MNNKHLFLILVLFTRFSFAVDEPTRTLTDYQYLDSLIAMENKREAKDLLNHEQIQDYFSENQNFITHCFTDDKIATEENALFGHIIKKNEAMSRQATIRVDESKFGYNLNLTFSSIPLPYETYSQTLDCTESEFSCSQLSAEYEWTALVDQEDKEEVQIAESWQIIIGSDMQLYAKAYLSITQKKRNWLGAPTGTNRLDLNYTCYLESFEATNNNSLK